MHSKGCSPLQDPFRWIAPTCPFCGFAITSNVDASGFRSAFLVVWPSTKKGDFVDIINKTYYVLLTMSTKHIMFCWRSRIFKGSTKTGDFVDLVNKTSYVLSTEVFVNGGLKKHSKSSLKAFPSLGTQFMWSLVLWRIGGSGLERVRHFDANTIQKIEWFGTLACRGPFFKSAFGLL